LFKDDARGIEGRVLLESMSRRDIKGTINFVWESKVGFRESHAIRSRLFSTLLLKLIRLRKLNFIYFILYIYIFVV
jgi:hypothetical protein